MPPPITTTSKCWPAIASIASARVSIGSHLVEEDGGLGAAGRSGAGRSWRGWPRWSRPTKRSPAGRPTAALPSSLAQQAGRAPVAGEAAGVGGEQDDVGGDGGRVQVLLVLDRIAARARRRRRPGSGSGRAWRRPRGRRPPSAAPATPGPTTRKRQGTVRWWLGAQCGELQQLVQLLARRAAPGVKALWVRRLRIAVSTSIGRGYRPRRPAGPPTGRSASASSRGGRAGRRPKRRQPASRPRTIAPAGLPLELSEELGSGSDADFGAGRFGCGGIRRFAPSPPGGAASGEAPAAWPGRASPSRPGEEPPPPLAPPLPERPGEAGVASGAGVGMDAAERRGGGARRDAQPALGCGCGSRGGGETGK